MTDHPITPPPELLEKWREELPSGFFDGHCWPERELDLCIKAAQWGADQELEACCEHMQDNQWGFVDRPDGTKIHRAVYLRQSRRPKPPSLKEQAKQALGRFSANAHINADEMVADFELLRRAMEQLDD